MKLRHTLAAALPIAALVATTSCDRREKNAKQAQEAPPVIRYEAHVSAGGVSLAGGTLTNPLKGNKQSAETGAGLFSSMNCDACHGGGALGWAAPSLADGRWRYGGAEEEVFHSIYYGRPKGMPAYGGVLGTEGVWMLVTYLQSLPVPDVVPTQSWVQTGDTQPAVKESTPAAESAPQTAAPAAASNPETMLTKYGCVACHAPDKKVIGPAFKDVAAKYHGQKDAKQVLAEKVRNGGVGVWGQIPMPPSPSVSDEDLQTLVEWILSR